MERTALDTSVVVPALLSWHEHHALALPLVQAVLRADGALVLPLPVLLESYAVMTRLPAPWRLSGPDAHALLDRSFRTRATVASLAPSDAWPLLDRAVEGEITGGTTYDAHVVACARKGGAVRLATFNRRHFERLDLGSMELVTPTP